MKKEVGNLPVKKAKDWDSLLQLGKELKEDYIFRGQPLDALPTTSFDRICNTFKIKEAHRVGLECQIIRDFKRTYNGKDKRLVRTDTLFCLDLMQHYGAPTRLSDWTYSFYIAAFFAFEKAEDKAAIWCINGKWLEKQAIAIDADIGKRKNDSARNDSTFLKVYFNGQNNFAMAENPLKLHKRHILQKGVFLCPTNVAIPLYENIKSMSGWNEDNNIFEIILSIKKSLRKAALNDLDSMNITNATLFPGFDGFVRSISNRIYYYESAAKAKAGQG